MLEPPFRLDEFNLEVQASIGIAIFPDHGTTADGLIKHADIAMYFAKGRNSGIEIYNAEHDQNSRRRLSLLSELRSALVKGEVVLYYQPKLDLSTGTVIGVEALVRWHHPIFGLIPPAEFVPFAEHTGLIRPLTNFVLRTAVTQARAWLDAGIETAVGGQPLRSKPARRSDPQRGCPPARRILASRESAAIGDHRKLDHG